MEKILDLLPNLGFAKKAKQEIANLKLCQNNLMEKYILGYFKKHIMRYQHFTV